MKRFLCIIANAFCRSAIISMICLGLLEGISTLCGHPLNGMTPEFISYFPSLTMAYCIDILIYGLIGATFAGFALIFEIDRIGFVIQNVFYCIGTSIFWIPLILFIWQLHHYGSALLGTVCGFLATYLVITILFYKKTKSQIADINIKLQKAK